MVFGGVAVERLQLNDDTCWSGAPRSGSAPDGPAALAAAREALERGDVREAERQVQRLQGGFVQAYQPLVDLWLEQDAVSRRVRALAPSRRGRRGPVLGDRYAGGVRQPTGVGRRRAPHLVRRTAARPGHLGAPARPADRRRLPLVDDAAAAVGRPTRLRGGRAGGPRPQPRDQHHRGRGGRGGHRRRRRRGPGRSACCDDATWVTVVVATATDYVDATTPLHGDADALRAQAAATASTAAARGVSAALRAEHVADHARLFDRVALDLGERRRADLPTDERLRRHAAGDPDPGLAALAFHHGRYLLIAGSRPGHAADDPAGDLERRRAAAVVEQLHDQHQHRDELLAGAEHEPRGVPRAAPALGRRAGRVGHPHGRRAVRAARLGRPPQLRRVGVRRVRGRRHQRPVVVVLAVRGRLARPAPGRPPRLHRGPRRPVRAARCRAVRPRLAGRAPRRHARHPPVDVPGEHLRRPGRPARRR